MSEKSLSDGITQAGSPMRLLWKPSPQYIVVPVVPPEYIGWAQEQAAWQEGVVLFNLSYHMATLFVEGPDSLQLLKRVFANDMEKFEIGQGKQSIAVTPRGHMVSDGILMRMDENTYQLNGVPTVTTWVQYHAEKSGLDVKCTNIPAPLTEAEAAVRPNFRYQVQGLRALEMIERLLGGPPPEVKFFHSVKVEIAGRKVRAFRHGMTGLPGFEFIGEWEDHDVVRQALLDAGAPFDMVQIGGLAYYTNAVESGWVPLLVPGIYDDPQLADYRAFVRLHSFEGQRPLHGSFYSDNIEDYYLTPYDVGYGRLVKFNHDFIGREALEAMKDKPHRTRVTLVLDPDDVRSVLGDIDYLRRDPQDRVEVDGKRVGLSLYACNMPVHGTILALALIDPAHATPGTRVSVVWGEHPGPGIAPDAHRELPRIGATVQASPYAAFARTQYRRSAA